MNDGMNQAGPAITSRVTETNSWLVITHDEYFGYRLERFTNEFEARERYDRYPHGIVRWPVFLAHVVEGDIEPL
ncbi:MAG: hypothetical protein ACXVAO_09275 [Vulcanimicrobiaceae bacterium]